MKGEMVERVAKALASNIEDGFPRFTKQLWGDLTGLARAMMRQRARVAIEAMREPTDDMIERIATEFSCQLDKYGSGASPRLSKYASDEHILQSAKSLLSAMIDAALK